MTAHPLAAAIARYIREQPRPALCWTHAHLTDERYAAPVAEIADGVETLTRTGGVNG